jgi:hypothetical protein
MRVSILFFLLDLFHPFFSKRNRSEKEGEKEYMDRLVECLKTVDDSSLPDDMDVRLDVVDHPLIDEIEFIATRLFIDDKGEPLFEEIDRLFREYKYFIYPGERDRFGWVTACIQTKKGFIVFG